MDHTRAAFIGIALAGLTCIPKSKWVVSAELFEMDTAIDGDKAKIVRAIKFIYNDGTSEYVGEGAEQIRRVHERV